MTEEKNDTPKENEEEKLESLKNQLRDTLTEEGEEKLKFLKREEIRTMKKDIARLREIEAEKEKEKIMALENEKEIEKKKKRKEEEERKKEAEKERTMALENEKEQKEIEREEKEEKVVEIKAEKEKLEVKESELEQEILLEDTLIPKPPKRPSSFKKILVRIGIVLLFAFLITGLYWLSTSGRIILEDIFFDFFTIPKERLPEPEEKEPEEKPEITIPSSFVPIKEIKTFEISKNEEIPSTIGQLAVEDLTESAFTRIIIKNIEENRLANLKDIAQSFRIELPSEVIEKLDADNFNFLIYPQKEGKREVFIVKINKKKIYLNL